MSMMESKLFLKTSIYHSK